MNKPVTAGPSQYVWTVPLCPSEHQREWAVGRRRGCSSQRDEQLRTPSSYLVEGVEGGPPGLPWRRFCLGQVFSQSLLLLLHLQHDEGHLPLLLIG